MSDTFELNLIDETQLQATLNGEDLVLMFDSPRTYVARNRVWNTPIPCATGAYFFIGCPVDQYVLSRDDERHKKLTAYARLLQ